MKMALLGKIETFDREINIEPRRYTDDVNYQSTQHIFFFGGGGGGGGNSCAGI